MSRTPEVEQAIRHTVDTYVCGAEGYAWRGTARILAAEVERLEKRENELINALDMGQINCDAVYDELREERDDARARAEAAEARVAELEAQVKGTMQKCGSLCGEGAQ